MTKLQELIQQTENAVTNEFPTITGKTKELLVNTVVEQVVKKYLF